MPKGSQSESTALVVLGSAQMLPKVTLSKLQAAAAEQFGVISRTEKEIPVRAFLLGIMLHRIKPSMKGEFSRWIQSDLAAATHWTAATAKKNASFYMRLAAEVIQHTEATKPELQALPEGNVVALESFEGSARRYIARVEKFFDGRSLNELLSDLGIKDGGALGGARTKLNSGSNSTPDAEQLYLFARDEIGGVIQRAEELLVKENRLQHLASHPEEVRGVVASFRELADRIEAAAKPLLKKGAS